MEEIKDEKITEKQQCTSKTLQGRRCSRNASVGDKCKTHSKCDIKSKGKTQIRPIVCGIVYHNHPPGRRLKNCQACSLKKKNTELAIPVICLPSETPKT